MRSSIPHEGATRGNQSMTRYGMLSQTGLFRVFSESPSTLQDAFGIRHAQLGNEGTAEHYSNNFTLPHQELFVFRIICLASLKGALSLFIPEYISSS